MQLRTDSQAAPPIRGNTALSSSNVRWRIMGLCLIISMVTYLDRVNISIAAKYIISENGLSIVQMGEVFSAFTLSYALFQAPGGWLADLFGSRITLTVAILWWSAFTALTAMAPKIAPFILLSPFVTLLGVRFLLGAGEAAAWPSFNRTIANWIPLKDRAFASSIPLAGGGIGASIAPPLVAWLMLKYGWHDSFYVCALIGAICGLVWLWYVRNNPAEHRGVNAEEQRQIESAPMPEPDNESRRATPWRTILSERNVWFLALSSMSCGYLIYIYLSWFYIYLTEARGMTLREGSYYTTGPFIAIAVMSVVGGLLGDRAVTKFGVTIGRRGVAILGMVVAGIALFVGARMPEAALSVVSLSIGAGAVFFALTAHWAASIDIGKRHAGSVSGVMNWVGNMGGVISPITTALIVKRWGWLPALEIAALIVLAGACLWPFIHPERPIAMEVQGLP